MEDKAKVILSIPLGTKYLEDKFIWALTENSLFSVKSAYFLAISKNKEKQGCTFNPKQQPSKWKYIWQLSILPKVQNFR